MVKGIYVDLDMDSFQKNFQQLMSMFGRSVSGFADGRRIRFWAHPDLVKSDLAKGLLTRAYERQKFFLEAIMQDYCSSILYLDTIPEGSSLPTLRKMILDIKSTTLPNIPLFHSVDRTCNRMRYRGDFTFLYLPHLAQEAELMMKNLLVYLHYQWGDDILLYFTDTAKEEAQGDK